MRQEPAPDHVIAAVATRQHGVISTRQLLDAGLSLSGISRRVRNGRLHREHRGVYSVGHVARSPARRWMAAVIACRRDDSIAGEDEAIPILERWGAALSHLSAAYLWGILPTKEGPVDISIPENGGKAERRGVRVHRCRTLIPAVVTLRAGIPVTTPARTLADLRKVASRGKRSLVSASELRRAIRQADVLGLPIGDDTSHDRTRSELERRFLCLCRRHGLPSPEVNVRIDRYLVDFLWRDRNLVVETDGYRYHRGRVAFEDDRDRDIELRALGYEVIRLSDRQVRGEQRLVGDVLKTALSGPGQAGMPSGSK
jgi:very-short-patch-repair endonuclease